MTGRSWPGILIGATIALSIPVVYYVVAILLDKGIAVIARDGTTMNTLTTIALGEALLGPIGIVVAGRSVGLRGAIGWLAYLVVTIPVVFVGWFIGVAMLSGALGSPF